MYEWKVEELKLMNGYNQNLNCYINSYEWTQEDKITFIDKHDEEKMSYVLNLIDKFAEDYDSIKKDKSGKINTNSLKAWIKKNDPRRMIDSDYTVGNIYYIERDNGYFSRNYNIKLNDKEKALSSLDKCLNHIMGILESKELKYFKEHDPYEIAKTKWYELGSNCFGNNIAQCSNGHIYVVDGDRYEKGKERDITFEELQLLINQSMKLKEFEEELKKKTIIKY